MLSHKVKDVVGRKLKTKNTYAVLTPEGQSNCNSKIKISWTSLNDWNINKITYIHFTNETDTFYS